MDDNVEKILQYAVRFALGNNDDSVDFVIDYFAELLLNLSDKTVTDVEHCIRQRIEYSRELPQKEKWQNFQIVLELRIHSLGLKQKPIGRVVENLAKSGKRNQTIESRRTEFNKAFQQTGECDLPTIASILNISSRTVRSRVREFENEYLIEKGTVKKK